jgi:FtsP/CotA-like multicopper oxidase with cupredoxin domain
MFFFTRRSFLAAGAAAGAAGVLGIPAWARKGSGSSGSGASGGFSKSGKFFGYTPFTQPLFIPAVLTNLGYGALTPTPQMIANRGPIAPTGRSDDVTAGIAPEFGYCPDWNQFNNRTHEQEFLMFTEETTQQFVPGGPYTPVFTYRDGANAPGSGRTPGPTVLVDYRGPAVLRNCNLLTRDRSGVNTTDHDVETSIHLHGSHVPAHADGYPEFYVLAGEARDYYYPNIAPRATDPATNVAPICTGPFDEAWIPSTLWYHDHAMDITGFNVAHGLAGFYLVVDDRERFLESTNVIPTIGGPQDIGLAIADQQFNGDGTIRYDFLEHDGRIGDVFTVNGVVQPYLEVERRKYRFRILNASNARVYELRLSNGRPFVVIGTDSWLLPEAIATPTVEIAAGERHDAIVDFRGLPNGTEVFLENILVQEDGRKPKEIDPSKKTVMMKFVVTGTSDVVPDVSVEDGTRIRGRVGDGGTPPGQWAPIREEEIVATRTFRFDRAMGAWTVNNRFFNPRRADAVPEIGVGAERWILENHSGGWWHPIHTHLEGFQIQKETGGTRPIHRFNNDLAILRDGHTAEVFIKFRTFTGPFVFHCHTIEHEDMRMMGTHDPTAGPDSPPGVLDVGPPLDGETRIAPAVSGIVPTCEELEDEKRILFDEVGDLERLEDRGVGFRDCEFDNNLRGNQGREDD